MIAKTLTHAIELAIMSHGPDYTADAHATPVAACATRIRNERVLFDPQWIFQLDSLNRKVGGVGNMNLHAVLAVAGCACAHAPTEGFQINVHLATARISASENR